MRPALLPPSGGYGNRLVIDLIDKTKPETRPAGQSARVAEPPPAGAFVVAIDAGHGYQVYKFSPEGKLLLTLGKGGQPGGAPDEFSCPTDVAVAPDGRDRKSTRLNSSHRT